MTLALVVMVSGLYIYPQTHKIVHIQHAQFFHVNHASIKCYFFFFFFFKKEMQQRLKASIREFRTKSKAQRRVESGKRSGDGQEGSENM